MSKKLVAYFSATGVTAKVAETLADAIGANLYEIEPAVPYTQADLNWMDKKSRSSVEMSNPASRPEIVKELPDLSQYDTVIIGTPLWWSNMAAPMQTFLFHNGKAMAGKKIGLIVSSASSGISGVERDAKRLIPEGNFTKSLWIRSSQFSSAPKMVAEWLKANGLASK